MQINDDASSEYGQQAEETDEDLGDMFDQGIDSSRLPTKLLDLLLNRRNPDRVPYRWGLVDNWSEDNPFTDYEPEPHSSRNTLNETIRAMYSNLGVDSTQPHQCKPLDCLNQNKTTNITAMFPWWRRFEGYVQSEGGDYEHASITNLSKDLNGLLAHPTVGLQHIPTRRELKARANKKDGDIVKLNEERLQYEDACEEGVAFIARHITRAHSQVSLRFLQYRNIVRS